jgi:short-subunit dehydrogenase
MSLRPAVLITGASTGIGATYAERFAHRGHDLVLVSRNEARMTELATRLRNETGVTIEILPADLTCDDDLLRWPVWHTPPRRAWRPQAKGRSSISPP